MKKKLLIVIQLVRRGGVELAAINFARNIDKNKFDISFLLIDPQKGQNTKLFEELKREGFEFIEMPEKIRGYADKYKFISKLMKREHYDIVHSHVILFSGLVLMAAAKNGVPVRVSHSHTVMWNRKENIIYKIYKFIMQMLLNKYSNVKLACSTKAGEFLYGKKEYLKDGIFLANGVDTDKFSYNLKLREKVRKEYGIDDNELLVGHIGTIYKIKNQTFLVDILSEMLKTNKNVKLILVGEKIDIQPVIDRANYYNIADKIIFAGQLSDVASVYQAMDIMIFPSLQEAFPLTLVEAQAAKLPCLISTAVTREIQYNSNIEFMPLSESHYKWAAKAFMLINIDRNQVNTEKLVNACDIKVISHKLEEIYLR